MSSFIRLERGRFLDAIVVREMNRVGRDRLKMDI